MTSDAYNQALGNVIKAKRGLDVEITTLKLQTERVEAQSAQLSEDLQTYNEEATKGLVGDDGEVEPPPPDPEPEPVETWSCKPTGDGSYSMSRDGGVPIITSENPVRDTRTSICVPASFRK